METTGPLSWRTTTWTRYQNATTARAKSTSATAPAFLPFLVLLCWRVATAVLESNGRNADFRRRGTWLIHMCDKFCSLWKYVMRSTELVLAWATLIVFLGMSESQKHKQKINRLTDTHTHTRTHHDLALASSGIWPVREGLVFCVSVCVGDACAWGRVVEIWPILLGWCVSLLRVCERECFVCVCVCALLLRRANMRRFRVHRERMKNCWSVIGRELRLNTATHCNILQHATQHCITLQHRWSEIGREGGMVEGGGRIIYLFYRCVTWLLIRGARRRSAQLPCAHWIGAELGTLCIKEDLY